MNTNDPPERHDLGEKVDAFAIGQKLLNRYKLNRVLGYGGMGVVWLARDEELERDVAMKFLPAIVVNDRAGLNELKRETKRSLELTHPNIVRTYDFVQDSHIAGISMEYVENDTLRNRRLDQPSGVFETAILGPWLRQLCSALDYAHTQAAIVHRDLKPANLMINARDQLKVADFGISRSLVDSVSQISLRRGVSGTLVYMSPQQLEGESPTPLDDVYALGATLYELLTSRPPFFSGDISGQVRGKAPASLRDRRESFGLKGSEIPDNWESAIASCLAKEPAERPHSAGEVAVRLGLCTAADITLSSQRGIGSANGVTLAPSSTTVPPASSARSRRALLATPVVLILAGLLWWIFAGKSLQLLQSGATAAGERPESAALAGPPGSLIIKTEPNGATVKVGDALPQIAPAIFSQLKPGTYPIQIVRDGYEAKTVSAEVKPNQATDLGIVSLTRSKGSLKITTKPDDLAYELRSEANPFQPLTGNTPMAVREFDAGNYSIKVSRPGWPKQSREVAVTRGETREAFFDFSGGDVTITSTPPGAMVRDDNKETLGQTPLFLKDQSPGEVKYTVALAGHESASVEGNIRGGESLTLNATLRKMPKATAQRSRSNDSSGAEPTHSTNKGEDERNEKIKRAFIPYYDIFHRN
jgi:serine/threonine protein kinase